LERPDVVGDKKPFKKIGMGRGAWDALWGGNLKGGEHRRGSLEFHKESDVEYMVEKVRWDPDQPAKDGGGERP